jgi:hypothetical protein
MASPYRARIRSAYARPRPSKVASRSPPMRRSLPALQAPALFLLGSVSMHGLRAADLSGESARDRSMPTLCRLKALSHDHSQSGFAQTLIASARQPYIGERFAIDLQSTVYALDSTMIDLCWSLFPWAKYRKVVVTHGKVHDLYLLHQINFEPGPSTSWTAATGVTNGFTKSVLPRRSSCDQISFSGFYAHKDHPDKLRRISFPDAETRKRLVFLNQQLCVIGDRHRRPLSLPLASRTLFQVDQAASAHQGILRNQRERPENSNMDRDFYLRPGRYRILQILSVNLFQ